MTDELQWPIDPIAQWEWYKEHWARPFRDDVERRQFWALYCVFGNESEKACIEGDNKPFKSRPKNGNSLKDTN
jgi:hypothetical protein